MAVAEAAAAVRRDGDALVLSGRLDRAAATVLWPAAQPLLAGVRTIELAAVDALDSAGLALLGGLAARIAGQGERPRVSGAAPGLAELCAAYRMDPNLDFAGTPP